jgi:hypothetical protein
MATGFRWSGAKATKQFRRRKADENHTSDHSADGGGDDPVRLALRRRMQEAQHPDAEAHDPDEGHCSDCPQQPPVRDALVWMWHTATLSRASVRSVIWEVGHPADRDPHAS